MTKNSINQAAKRAYDAAEKAWWDRLTMTDNILPSAGAPHHQTMWREVMRSPKTSLRWGRHSFKSEDLQIDFMKEVFKIIAEHQPGDIKAQDTHKSGGTRNPPSRPDFTIVLTGFEPGRPPRVNTNNVPWSEAVSSGELKRTRGEMKWGRMQFIEFAWQVMQQQEGREFVIGFVIAGTDIEFLKLSKDGEVGHTAQKPLLAKKDTQRATEGFKQLAIFMGMSPEDLGAIDIQQGLDDSSWEDDSEEEEIEEAEEEEESESSEEE